MRDTLPTKINSKEAGIVNLDSVRNSGTHWVCYKKKRNVIYYFDSFGNLKPPAELVKYFQSSNEHPLKIYYNYNRYQSFNSVVCGHLCLKFLSASKKHVFTQR